MLYPHFLHPKFHGDLGASPMSDGYMLSNMASGMASLIYPATRLQLLMSLLRLPQADVTLGAREMDHFLGGTMATISTQPPRHWEMGPHFEMGPTDASSEHGHTKCPCSNVLSRNILPK